MTDTKHYPDVARCVDDQCSQCRVYIVVTFKCECGVVVVGEPEAGIWMRAFTKHLRANPDHVVDLSATTSDSRGLSEDQLREKSDAFFAWLRNQVTA